MSSQLESKDDKGQSSKLNPLLIYTTCVSCLGIALLLWSLLHLSSSFPDVLLFIGLVVISELTTSDVFAPQIVFSMSSAVTFATLLLFGPLSAALVAMVGGLVITLVVYVIDIRQGRSREASVLRRALFNMAAFGLSAAFAGAVYLLSGGKVGEIVLPSNLLPMLLAAVLSEFANAALVVVVVSFQTGRPAFQIWKQNVSWAVPINILSMIVGGSGLALGYQIAGTLGLLVFFLPIALTIYAVRLYVTQTKTQMSRLEEVVAERTEDLRKANEELKRLDRVKDRFFSVINHEMRSPLTAILGYTDLLRFTEPLTSDQSGMLNHVRANSQRLLDLVNNLLDISRLEEGRLQILSQAISVLSAVEQAQSVVAPMAEKKRIGIVVDVPPMIPHVYGDPRRVIQILVNLLSNAIKYTPDTGRVLVSVRMHDATPSMIEISVSDNGPGIPADELPYIFDRFSRVERAEIQNIIGTGLGLSIAKGLVDAHGGEIWVESEEGLGATFTFTLPTTEQLSEETFDQEFPGTQ